MKPNMANNRETRARVMVLTTFAAGVVGLIVLLMPDGMLLTFMVTATAVAGVSTSRKDFDERENQLLGQSFSSAFEQLFIGVYLAYTFVVFSNWLQIGGGITAFANSRWPGLVASAMCILVSVNAWRHFKSLE